MMLIVRYNPMSSIDNLTRNDCAAVVSLIHASLTCCAITSVATDRSRQNAVAADSESWFLAIKKFSCTTAWRRIAARQTRFFAGIVTADSRVRFSSAPRLAARRAWLMHAGARLTRRRAPVVPTSRRATFRCRVWT
jgi:hypothetical protein